MKKPLHKYQEHVLFWVSFLARCQNGNVHGYLLNDSNQLQRRWIPFTRILMCLGQRAAMSWVDGSVALTNELNLWRECLSPFVDDDFRTKAQPLADVWWAILQAKTDSWRGPQSSLRIVWLFLFSPMLPRTWRELWVGHQSEQLAKRNGHFEEQN